MALEYSYVLPPVGTAENAVVREMFEDVKTFVDSIIAGGGTGAPVDAQYVTLATNANLTVERVLTAGTAISLTDNGAGSTAVIANTGVTSVVAGSGISVSGATGAVTITNTNAVAGANTALSNLASVAINTSLLAGTTNSIDLGSAAKTWRDVHIDRNIVLYENTTSNVILIKAPTSLASYTLTLPDTAGTNTYLLQTNGSGTTSWVAPVSTSNFATKALDNLAGVAINTSLLSDTDNTDDLGSAGKTWKLGYFKSGIHFMEQDGGVDTILLKAPNTVGTAYTFTLPGDDGTSGYVLQTDGSGTTSWVDPGSFPAGANTALSNLASVAVNTSIISDSDAVDDLGSSALQWNYVYSRNLLLGKSGALGNLVLYPATAANGFVEFYATNNGGARNLSITNAAISVTCTYTIPDAGGNASFVLTAGAQSITGAKTFQSILFEETGVGSDTITLQAPASIGASYTLTLPDTDGSANQVLTTDGSGVLSWASSGGTVHREDYVVGTALNNYTGSTTVFDLNSTYTTADGSMIVAVDGVTQTIGAAVDYLETDTNTITFNNALSSGQKVAFIWSVPTSGTDYATKALDNLGSVAINTALISDTDITDDLGSSSKKWKDIYARGIVGTTTNDSAQAGSVGEYIESVVGPITGPTSGQYKDVTSISLTAGDWDVTAVAHYDNNGATAYGSRIGISTTSGNSSAGLTVGSNALDLGLVNTAIGTVGNSIASYRVSLSATTTYYFKWFSSHATATPNMYGRLSARRIR